jgi:DNA-binding FadR family transcriptional regulator
MNAAERIYVASTSEGEMAWRLAEALARRLEDDIASRDLAPGGVLGSVRELAERYSVGRSVAREALGLLERRGLGRMRPGPSGGFILARPQPHTIGEQLAEYFRATGVTLRHLMDAREAVDLMAARLAAAVKPSDTDLVRLQAQSTADLAGMLSARVEIARLASDPVLLLFVECLNSLTADFVRRDAPAVLALGERDSAKALASALRAGNPDKAVAEATRSHLELAR